MSDLTYGPIPEFWGWHRRCHHCNVATGGEGNPTDSEVHEDLVDDRWYQVEDRWYCPEHCPSPGGQWVIEVMTHWCSGLVGRVNGLEARLNAQVLINQELLAKLEGLDNRTRGHDSLRTH